MNKNEVLKELQLFISYLYLKHPFYNSLLSSIDLEIDSTEKSKKYGIFSPDNSSIIIDYNFASKELKKNKKLFFYYIVHELLHIILKHKTRGIGKNNMRWQLATDMAVEAVIHQDKVLNEIIQTPNQSKGIGKVYDYNDQVSSSAEDFYRTLNISDLDQLSETKGDNEESENPKQAQKEKKCDTDNESEEENISKTQNGNLNNHEWSMSDKDINEEENQINEKIMQAYQFIQMNEGLKGSGGVPGCFMEIIEGLTTPKTNLVHYINKIVQNFKKYSNTYKRGDRRYLYNKLIVPSKVKTYKHFKLLFYIDTSGSVGTKELQKCLSELYHIIKSLKSFEIDIVQSDVGIHDIYKVTDKTGLDLEKFLTVKGRGGTEMKPLFDLLETDTYDFTLVSSDWHLMDEELNGLEELTKSINIGFLSTERYNKKVKHRLTPMFFS